MPKIELKYVLKRTVELQTRSMANNTKVSINIIGSCNWNNTIIFVKFTLIYLADPTELE